MKTVPTVRAGVFSGLDSANSAIEGLVAAGFGKSEITVVCAEADAHRFTEFHQRDPAGSHSGRAATWGIALGAFVGGVCGILVIIFTDTPAMLIIPPVLAGLGICAFIGAMVSRGFESESTNYHDQALPEGSILVAIQDGTPTRPDRLFRAEAIFAKAGAPTVKLAEG